MIEYFNEYLAPLANLDRIETLTTCTQCGMEIYAEDAVTSEHYPDAMFCSTNDRARFYHDQEPAEPLYYEVNEDEEY